MTQEASLYTFANKLPPRTIYHIDADKINANYENLAQGYAFYDEVIKLRHLSQEVLDGFAGRNLAIKNVQQVGCSDGQVVRWNDLNQVIPAIADSEANSRAIGIITNIDGDFGDVYIFGTIDFLSSLTAGLTYYLSDSTAGSLTTTKPTGNIVVKIGIAKSVNTFIIDIDREFFSYNHNDLDNIQGGLATERYHLAQSDYDNLINNYPNFNNMFIGQSAAKPGSPLAGLYIATGADQLIIDDVDGGVDEKRWVYKADLGILDILLADDSWSNWVSFFTMKRIGIAPIQFKIPTAKFAIGSVDSTSHYGQVQIKATNDHLLFENPNAPADEKFYLMKCLDTGDFNFDIANDGWSSWSEIFNVKRTGMILDVMNFTNIKLNIGSNESSIIDKLRVQGDATITGQIKHGLLNAFKQIKPSELPNGVITTFTFPDEWDPDSIMVVADNSVMENGVDVDIITNKASKQVIFTTAPNTSVFAMYEKVIS